jgi:hypothetical protein
MTSERPPSDFFARPVEVWPGDFFAADTEPSQGETARKGLERLEPPDGPWFLPGGHYPEPDPDPGYAAEAEKFRRELLARANPPASEPAPDPGPADNKPSIWARLRGIHG